MRTPSSGAAGIDLIVGAGPAGLTAARELLETAMPPPRIVEAEIQVSETPKTIDHYGEHIALGGSRR